MARSLRVGVTACRRQASRPPLASPRRERNKTVEIVMAKILIIDDGPVNRQFLTTLLGYEHHPDLIISDVLMPTMDGYEFVRQLREDPGIGRIPVVFSTAHYLSRESQALALKCGITSIIYKPCEPKVVLD